MSLDGKPSEQEVAISRVYARALLSVAREGEQVESVLEELSDLVGLADRDEAFARFLTSPLIDSAEREVSLERLFRGRMSDLMLDTLLVMNRKSRMELVPALAETYREEVETLRGEIRVQVKSAVELDDAQRRELTQAVARLTRKRATLLESVDSSLIGGVVLRIGDRKIDTSVARSLGILGEQMAGRVAHELHTGKTFISEEAQ
ncbi:MAG: ATP synthase F1 subunit delta [Acidobacteriota bacterium]